MFICLPNGIHGSETSHNATIKPALGTFGSNLQNNYKEANLSSKPNRAAAGESRSEERLCPQHYTTVLTL